MAKIAFWTAGYSDPAIADACTFYRCIEPARVLAARGHETLVDHEMGLATMAEQDVLVVQRPTETGPRTALEKLHTLPEDARPRIVVELDDDLFSVPEHNPAHPMMADQSRRYRLQRAIEMADVVTVPTAHLREQILTRRNPWPRDYMTVIVVPNYVPERFVVDAVPTPGERTWITWAGSDTHRRDFDQVAVALRKLLRERGDVGVRIVGAPYHHRLLSALGPLQLREGEASTVVHLPWTEGVPNYIGGLDGHVGLAPLVDDLFNRSKSDLRPKELAARGMLPVSSNVGPYADSPVEQYRVGTAPWAYETWYDAISWWLNNGADRADAAAVSLGWARANTLEAHADDWEKALLS